MKPLIFTFTHDSIFQGVKQEASLYAERKFDENGNSLFEQFVFDEEYYRKFRELFFDAQANVIAVLSAYMRDLPSEYLYFESSDFSKNRDFIFAILLPKYFNAALITPIDNRIREYLIAFILYRWLETKIPQEAVIYFDRANNVLEDIKRMMETRTRVRRRKHGLF